MTAPQIEINSSINPLADWIPYQLVKAGEEWQCHWINTQGREFIEPFFEETILKCKWAESSKFRSVSSPEMIGEWAKTLRGVEPAAIIFHISRCGSTLVSQLLATSANNVVLSEVPFFDDILRMGFKQPGVTTAQTDAMFLDAIKYYAQKITTRNYEDKPKRLFIKADSWHIFFYRQLRLLYPATPFIFIYRRPDEVFNSHGKQPGMQAVRGLIEPQLFGFTPEDMECHPQTYLANVLARYLKKYLEVMETDSQCMVLNYSEGPMQMISKIAAFAGVNFSPADMDKMKGRSAYHSKKPGERFAEEAAPPPPPYLSEAMDLYSRVEEKRLAGVNSTT